MKKYIRFIIGLFLILTFGMSNATFNNSDLVNSYNKVLTLKSGNKYVKSIDLIMEKYGENREFLNKLKTRLEEIDMQVAVKSDLRSRDLKILLDYLYIKTSFALNDLENLNSEINTTETGTINQDNNSEQIQDEEIVYPGFSTEYNDNTKTFLAGKEEFVFAGGVGALYERAEVNKLSFYITGNNIEDFKNSLDKANLYVEGLNLSTAYFTNVEVISSIKAKITFDNISNFILPDDKNIDYRLSIKTKNIGYQKVGKTLKDLIVSDVSFDDVLGLSSDKKITNINIQDFSSEYFSIVPGIVNINLIKNFESSLVTEFKLVGDFGFNTIEANNGEPSINFSKLKLSVFGTDASIATYTLYNNNDSQDKIIGIYNSGIVEFDLSSMMNKNKSIVSGNGKNFTITISGITTGISAEILRDGITYDINGISNSTGINANLDNSITLGYRDF